MSIISDQHIQTDLPSPVFSAASSGSTSLDSDSTTSDGPDAHSDMLGDLEDNKKALLLHEDVEEEDEGDIENEANLVIFRRALPRSPRSATPDEEEAEERAPSTDYPQSQRIYSSPSCGISAVLQRQCSELWMQFDSIGTEMIVTRRGR